MNIIDTITDMNLGATQPNLISQASYILQHLTGLLRV